RAVDDDGELYVLPRHAGGPGEVEKARRAHGAGNEVSRRLSALADIEEQLVAVLGIQRDRRIRQVCYLAVADGRYLPAVGGTLGAGVCAEYDAAYHDENPQPSF